jgi:alkylhydroperoxidase family enzyme
MRILALGDHQAMHLMAHAERQDADEAERPQARRSRRQARSGRRPARGGRLDACEGAALRADFSEDEALFLTVAIGVINQSNRIGVARRFAPPSAA